MIASIFFFIVAYLCGRAIVKLCQLDLDQVLMHLTSMVVGLVVICGFLFFEGIVFGSLGLLGVVITLVVIGILSGWVMKEEIREIRKIREIWKKIKRSSFDSLRSLRMTKTLFIQIFFVVLVLWLFGRSLFFNAAGALVAGDRLVWTDWPLHIGMSSNFAFGANFPPQNPHFAGIALNYPFMADFLSGILLILGASLPMSFINPGIILILCFFGLFVKFAGEVAGSDKGYKGNKDNKEDKVGYLALFLSLFWGGLGWYYWLKEAFSSEVEFISTLLTPPREYTFWAEKNLWFFTFLYSEILPQRAFIFGLPMFFLVLILIKRGWDDWVNPSFAKASTYVKTSVDKSAGKKGDHKKYLIIAGVFSGVMPFFHAHSFMSLWILTGCWFLISLFTTKKSFSFWLWFFIPFGVLSLIQAPFFLNQSSKLQYLWGWTKGEENFIFFWWKNTGLFWPLLVLGLYLIKIPRFFKSLFIASLFLFIIPNFLQFAPWPYDNLKIFTYWYLLGSIVVSWMLIRIWKIKVIGKIGMIMLVLTLTLSGMVEVCRLVNTKAINIQLWSKEDQELAVEIRDKTPKNAVFLTAAIHDHPIEALSGRKIILGYPGNSWSWGIAGWDTREKDIHDIYQGVEGAKELLKKYGINYIVLGDRERWFEPKLNEDFIIKNGELVIEKGRTRVYRIN